MQSNVQAQVPINPDMDARQLFDLLKFDKSSQTVDKSTLQALLLYCDVDKVDSFFFNSISNKIDAINKDQLTLEEFVRIFDFSKDAFPRMGIDELSQLFLMFNPNNNQEISCDEFLKVYKASPGYQNDEAQVRQDFETINPSGKSISPEEFLRILNAQEGGQQQQSQNVRGSRY